MAQDPTRTVTLLTEFVQPALTLLAAGILLWLAWMVSRPLPAVVAQGPAPPAPEVPLELGPRPSPRAPSYSSGGTLTVAAEANARKTFSKACAPCHASGGPHDLLHGTYRHGDDDDSVFRSIRRGVPGTAMGAAVLPDETVWTLVRWLRANRS